MAYSVVQHTNSLTFGSNLTAGNAAFLGITYTSTFTLTGVSGSTNGAYTQAVTFNNGSNTGKKFEIWYKANVASGAETLTLTGVSGANVDGWFVVEVSGLSSSFTVDVTTNNSAASASTMTFTLVPTAADFIMAVAYFGGASGTVTNITFLDVLNSSKDYSNTTAGSGSITCTDTGPTTLWGVVAAAFKPSGGGNVVTNVSGNLLVTATQAATVGVPVAPLTTGVLGLTGRVIVQGFTPPPSGGTTVTNPPWWWAWIK